MSRRDIQKVVQVVIPKIARRYTEIVTAKIVRLDTQVISSLVPEIVPEMMPKVIPEKDNSVVIPRMVDSLPVCETKG